MRKIAANYVWRQVAVDAFINNVENAAAQTRTVKVVFGIDPRTNVIPED